MILVALATACGPHLVEHPVASRTYVAAADATCGQQLAATTFVAKGARWGESIRVQACAYHGMSGYVEVSADREDYGRFTWNGSLGSDRDRTPGRCQAGDPVDVGPGGGGGSATAAGSAAGPADRVSSSAPAARASSALAEVTYSGDICPQQMDTVMGLDRLRPGTTIEVRVWTKAPIDLAGAMLRITHNVDKPNVSDAEWEKHLAAEEKKRRKQEEKWLAEEKRHPHREPVHWRAPRAEIDEPTGAPPPPRAEDRPPSPGGGAEWIPGYWHWHKGWYWVIGQWRIPTGYDAVVAAPYAPPPLRAEQAHAALGVDLVWMPGYWAWSGRTYVWIGGGWGRPPRAGVTWRAAEWRARGSGVVFVPGRWAAR